MYLFKVPIWVAETVTVWGFWVFLDFFAPASNFTMVSLKNIYAIWGAVCMTDGWYHKFHPHGFNPSVVTLDPDAEREWYWSTPSPEAPDPLTPHFLFVVLVPPDPIPDNRAWSFVWIPFLSGFFRVCSFLFFDISLLKKSQQKKNVDLMEVWRNHAAG